MKKNKIYKIIYPLIIVSVWGCNPTSQLQRKQENEGNSGYIFTSCTGLNKDQCKEHPDKCEFYEQHCLTLQEIAQLKAQKGDEIKDKPVEKKQILKEQPVEQTKKDVFAEPKREVPTPKEQFSTLSPKPDAKLTDPSNPHKEVITKEVNTPTNPAAPPILEEPSKVGESLKNEPKIEVPVVEVQKPILEHKVIRTNEQAQEINLFILEILGVIKRLRPGAHKYNQEISKKFLTLLAEKQNLMTLEELEKIEKVKETLEINARSSTILDRYSLQELSNKVDELNIRLTAFLTQLNNFDQDNSSELKKITVASNQLRTLKKFSMDIKEIEKELTKQTSIHNQLSTFKEKFENMKKSYEGSLLNATNFLGDACFLAFSNKTFLLAVQKDAEAKASIIGASYTYDVNFPSIVNIILYAKTNSEFHENFISYEQRNKNFEYTSLNNELTEHFIKLLWNYVLEGFSFKIDNNLSNKDLQEFFWTLTLLENFGKKFQINEEESDKLAKAKDKFNEKYNDSDIPTTMKSFEDFIQEIQNWTGKTTEIAYGTEKAVTIEGYQEHIEKLDTFNSLKDIMKEYPDLFWDVNDPANYHKRIRELIDEMQEINRAENELANPPAQGWTLNSLTRLINIFKLDYKKVVNTDEFPIAKKRYEEVSRQLDIELGKTEK